MDRRKSTGALFPSSKLYDKQFKVIIIGDAACGKTTLLMRMVDGKSDNRTDYEMTVGVDCRSKTFEHTIYENGLAEEKRIKL